MKKTIFIKNAAILTISSLLLRFAGIIFKVWLAQKIGSEGIGLYQIVFSVYMFVATFATSGICTAVTRLVSEQLAIGNKSQIGRIMVCCISISCVIATISIIVLYFGSSFIANHFLQDIRARLSLKILGFSLPFMGICSCIKGYFIARRKASPSSVAQLLEQTVRILLIILLINNYNNLGLEYTCAAIIIGDTIAEAISCIFIYIRYKFDFKRLKNNNLDSSDKIHIVSSVSHIALPITAGRYLNSLLRTIENILVPIYLAKSSVCSSGISLFGMIKGMALPILFFPSTLLQSLSTLLIPEISEASICGKKLIVRSITYRIIKITGIISIIFSALFLVVGKQLGFLLYKNADVGFLLCALSPIVPFMYLDAVCDGILKGLDQQKFTFFTSIIDSVIRILLIVILLKNKGIYGFLGIMYFSNFFTAVLNVKRLIKVSGLNIDFAKVFIFPTCGAFSICLILKILLSNIFILPNFVYLVLVCFFGVMLYIVYLVFFGIIDRDDAAFLKIK